MVVRNDRSVEEILIKKIILWILIILIILTVIIVGGVIIWTNLSTAEPMPDALAALQSNDEVEVTNDEWLIFTPKQTVPTTGFIFYPGGLVDPRAYAPPAHTIAAEGYQVVIVPMPLNLAVIGSGKATDIINAFPEIEQWVIGGHSLGGTMASQYANQNPDQVSGLVLWASYPAENNNLSGYNLIASSIYGTRDGFVTQENIESSRALLPPDTAFVAIEGGNHVQFGWYGSQDGDNSATISRLEQQEQTITATIHLLKKIQ
jgi:hypothetical protein